jgi:hypothetical protein
MKKGRILISMTGCTGRQLLGVLIVAQLCGGLAFGGTLKGAVTDATGARVPGALVRIERWSKANSLKSSVIEKDEVVYTNSEGEFSIHLSPGSYDVLVGHPGLLPYAKRIRVRAGKETELSPTLKLDPSTTVISN